MRHYGFNCNGSVVPGPEIPDSRLPSCFATTPDTAAIEPDMTAEAFTAKYPVGTPCRYYPIAGNSDHMKTKTRSEAWALGHGAVVVKIEGRTGGVDINHLVMEG